MYHHCECQWEKKIIAVNTLMHNCNKICIIEKKHCRAKEKKNPKKKIKIKSARFIILKSTLKNCLFIKPQIYKNTGLRPCSRE